MCAATSGADGAPKLPPRREEAEDTPSRLVSAIDAYAETNRKRSFAFIQERKIPIVHTISRNAYDKAESLGGGVSGAKRLEVGGTMCVVKLPIMTEVFKSNFEVAYSREGAAVSHSLVSESDDPFTEFPRKEVLGYHIARMLQLDVPLTQLGQLETREIVSVQEFIPPSEATTMMKIRGLSTFDVEIDSVFKTILFLLISSNIDGHSGNILMSHLEEREDDSDDDLAPKYSAIPIDYGLIFPRHSTIYPELISMMRKSLYQLFKGKRISVERHLKPLELVPERFCEDAQISSLCREHEMRNLRISLEAIQKIAAGEEPSMRLEDFVTKYVGYVVEMSIDQER